MRGIVTPCGWHNRNPNTSLYSFRAWTSWVGIILLLWVMCKLTTDMCSRFSVCTIKLAIIIIINDLLHNLYFLKIHGRVHFVYVHTFTPRRLLITVSYEWNPFAKTFTNCSTIEWILTVTLRISSYKLDCNDDDRAIRYIRVVVYLHARCIFKPQGAQWEPYW